MELIKYLPSFYHNSAEVKNIQASIENEDIKVKEAIKDVLNQLFVETATWGLVSWETMLNLQVDINEPLESRRARVKTRLRGTGTVTREMLKNVCESFTNGKVEIVENNSDSSFIIKFISEKGVPSNINYLQSAIEEIKPAHLNFSFEYLYNTHADIAKLIHSQMATSTYDELKVR